MHICSLQGLDDAIEAGEKQFVKVVPQPDQATDCNENRNASKAVGIQVVNWEKF
jgi:hypothetical protein